MRIPEAGFTIPTSVLFGPRDQKILEGYGMKRLEIIDISSMTPREKRRYARHLSQLDRRTDSYHSNLDLVELLSILGGGVIGVLFMFALVWGLWGLSELIK